MLKGFMNDLLHYRSWTFSWRTWTQSWIRLVFSTSSFNDVNCQTVSAKYLSEKAAQIFIEHQKVWQKNL